MKKAVFLGASNTYGVGLRYFNKYWQDSSNKLDYYLQDTHDDFTFTEKNRFSNLLSKYLNLKEINISEAGGSPAQSLYLLSKMNLNEIEYVVFEISALYSFFDRFIYEFGPENPPKTPTEIESFLTNGKNDNPLLKEKIYNWLDGYDYEDFVDELFTKIKEFIELNKTIKFILLPWRKFSIQFPYEKTNWVLNYSPRFKLKNGNFTYYVEEYLIDNDLTVNKEYNNYNLVNWPLIDLHPSYNGHQEIFKVLKSYIDEKNSTNSW